jgi:hypothetical protein
MVLLHLAPPRSPTHPLYGTPQTEPTAAVAGDASPPTSTAAATTNGSTGGAAAGGGGGQSPLSTGGIPYGTLFFRVQGRNPHLLLLAFDGSFSRPLLYRENAAGVEPSLLPEEETAEEGTLLELKCTGGVRVGYGWGRVGVGWGGALGGGHVVHWRPHLQNSMFHLTS